MSKPIKMTKEIYEEIVTEFMEKMSKSRMFDGSIEYKTKYVYTDDERVKVIFTTDAWKKMWAIIHAFSTEVAWHGIVERDGDKVFKITDILVYPQIVTGGTFDSEDGEYLKWVTALGPRLNQLRMQGHSHVNMGVGPSTTDLKYQKEFLEQVGDNDYYIFMIYNKRYEKTVTIYDLKNNIQYDTNDVDVSVEGGEDFAEFVEEAKKLVRTRTANTNKNYYGNTTYGTQGSYASNKKKGYSYFDYHDDETDLAYRFPKWDTEWEDDESWEEDELMLK